MNYRLLYAATTLLVAAALGTTWAGDDDGPKVGQSEDDKWQELEKARQLAVNATPEELQKQAADANDGVAIRAAWEEVRRRLSQDIAARPKNSEWTSFKGIDRFVGFVEGRLRIPVPQWWALELADARSRELERTYFFVHREVGDPIGPRGLSSAFGIVPTIKRSTSGEVKTSWDNRKLQFSAKQMPEEHFDSFAGLVYRDRCLIVQYIHDDFPSIRLDVYCVDPGCSKIVWSIKRTFDARPGSVGGSTGASIQHVELVGRNDVVFVFGMELSMFYIEALRLADGHPLMRFNDTY